MVSYLLTKAEPTPDVPICSTKRVEKISICFKIVTSENNVLHQFLFPWSISTIIVSQWIITQNIIKRKIIYPYKTRHQWTKCSHELMYFEPSKVGAIIFDKEAEWLGQVMTRTTHNPEVQITLLVMQLIQLIAWEFY